jgi:inner membrane protein
MPRQLLEQLGDRECSVRALLKFARAPWSAQLATGRVVGDLRFDREPGNSFAEITLGSADDTCPRRLPDWVAPRQDLLARP